MVIRIVGAENLFLSPSRIACSCSLARNLLSRNPFHGVETLYRCLLYLSYVDALYLLQAHWQVWAPSRVTDSFVSDCDIFFMDCIWHGWMRTLGIKTCDELTEPYSIHYRWLSQKYLTPCRSFDCGMQDMRWLDTLRQVHYVCCFPSKSTLDAKPLGVKRRQPSTFTGMSIIVVSICSDRDAGKH